MTIARRGPNEPPSSTPPSAPKWDPAQLAVIKAPPSARLLVTAGPGEGKSAVACARVAHLVDEDVAPSRIVLISFTRTAVAEISNRIRTYVGDDRVAAEVRISTIDAQAWRLRCGYEGDALRKLFAKKSEHRDPYAASIERVVELLKEEDETLLEYLGELEHVLIDEAQDVVGVRATLIDHVLRALARECGVTIFADPAQAIYGFTTDDGGRARDAAPAATSSSKVLTAKRKMTAARATGRRASTASALPVEAEPQELLRLLRQKPWKGKLQELALGTIYRTSEPMIVRLFKQARKAVEVADPADDHLTRVKKVIVKNASRSVGTLTHDGIHDVCTESKHEGSMLVLFRRRADVLVASSYCAGKGLEHRLRLSGVPPVVRPWLGWLLGEHTTATLSRKAFDTLWTQRANAAAAVFAGENKEDAWSVLTMLARAKGKPDTIDLASLRAVVARPRPPVELCYPDHGAKGPILGTIHASKGREAENVLLLFFDQPEPRPSDADDEDGDDNESDDEENTRNKAEVLEEGRVLYVGATRAKTLLAVAEGRARRAGTLSSGRVFCWTRKPGRVQLEVGRTGDVDARFSVAGPHASASQARLAALAGGTHRLVGKATPATGWEMRLFVDGESDGAPLGSLSKRFQEDRDQLWSRMPKKLGKVSPPNLIPYLYLVAVGTAAFSDDDRSSLAAPYQTSGFGLVPVLRGFPLLTFNQRKGNK